MFINGLIMERRGSKKKADEDKTIKGDWSNWVSFIVVCFFELNGCSLAGCFAPFYGEQA